MAKGQLKDFYLQDNIPRDGSNLILYQESHDEEARWEIINFDITNFESLKMQSLNNCFFLLGILIAIWAIKSLYT
jgi:hypothetical protein